MSVSALYQWIRIRDPESPGQARGPEPSESTEGPERPCGPESPCQAQGPEASEASEGPESPCQARGPEASEHPRALGGLGKPGYPRHPKHPRAPRALVKHFDRYVCVFVICVRGFVEWLFVCNYIRTCILIDSTSEIAL